MKIVPFKLDFERYYDQEEDIWHHNLVDQNGKVWAGYTAKDGKFVMKTRTHFVHTDKAKADSAIWKRAKLVFQREMLIYKASGDRIIVSKPRRTSR